mgnify:CR=1 FL=1
MNFLFAFVYLPNNSKAVYVQLEQETLPLHSNYKIQEVINEPVTFSEKLEVHKIKEFLSGAITKPTPADFKNLGILGVNPLNLPILLKLLKDLNISDLTPEIIKEQLRIANSILSKQLKAKQKAKAKK